ncbi:MAG: MFS transporter [Oscillospiraceae bacterium]
MCGIVNPRLFSSPMAKHFGWTTEAIAGVATHMAFMQTPATSQRAALGKIGAKKTLILGCILLGLAFLRPACPPAPPWMLYITFSVLQGLGVGFTYTGSTYCATGWYPDKRGFASGLCMAFNGGSATFLAPLIVKLIGSIGIIVTLYIVGGAIIVIGICAAIGLKSAPVGYAPAGWKAKADDPKLAATQLESLTPGQAFRTRGYWHLFLGYGLFPTMYHATPASPFSFRTRATRSTRPPSACRSTRSATSSAVSVWARSSTSSATARSIRSAASAPLLLRSA